MSSKRAHRRRYDRSLTWPGEDCRLEEDLMNRSHPFPVSMNVTKDKKTRAAGSQWLNSQVISV